MCTRTIVLLVTAILTLTEISDCAVKLTWPPNLEDKRIVCYYGSWASLRTGPGKFTPEDIDPFLCTHLIYAYAHITKDANFEPSDKVIDIDQGGYEKFTGLKRFNKALLTGISLGGWNEGSVKFGNIAANATKRSIFVQNTIKYLRQYNFDFFCFDWQFPSLKDRQSYTSLIKELREAFEIEALETNRFRLGLALTLPTLVDHVNRGYDIAEISPYVDCMHALTYNYHTEYEPLVYHHSQLYAVDDIENSDREVNANYTVGYYLASGAEHQKLALGVSTYGQVYNLSDPSLTDIGSPAAGPGLTGEAKENGVLAYFEICRKIKDDNWTAKQPYPDAMGQYAYKDNQWVGYDDENIMRKKGEFVANQRLGGIMFWLLEYDDFNGYCGGKQFPLIEAAKEGLQNALKKIDENDGNIKDTKKRTPVDVNKNSIPEVTINKPIRVPSLETVASVTNRINPFPASSVNPLLASRDTFSLNPTQSNNDNRFDEDEILTPLKKFVKESGGIEGLRRFLNMLENSTSKSKPVVTYGEVVPLDSRMKVNKPTRQTQQGGGNQPFQSEETVNGSKILNIVFNIDFQ